MPQQFRYLLTLLGLGLLEATPVAVLLTLWGSTGTWGALVLVVYVACMIETVCHARLPEQWQRPILALAAIGLALIPVARSVPGANIAASLLDLNTPVGLQSYLALLAGLFCAWRGTRLQHYEQVGLRELFGRSMALTLGALLIGGGTDLLGEAAGEIIAGFSAGLLIIALSRAAEPGERALRAAGWRAATPTASAIAAVLFIGLGLVALVGGQARQLVVLAIDLLAFLLSAILLPIALLLMPIVEWLLLALHTPDLLSSLQQFARQLEQRQQQLNPLADLSQAIPWAGPLLEWIGRLMPVIMLIALIWLMARRRTTPPIGDEERVSLFSWDGLAGDLADLLARLRRSEPEGLLAALARLQAGDPDTRIRRSYVRLLLAAERREHPRTNTQTPHEYCELATQALPHAANAITALTSAYEQARYAPGTATPSEASAAEQSWQAIERKAP
jgi:hypothetical protein